MILLSAIFYKRLNSETIGAERWWWYRVGWYRWYKAWWMMRREMLFIKWIRWYRILGLWMKKYSWRNRVQGGDIYQGWDVHWFHMVIVSWKKVFFWCLYDVCANDKKWITKMWAWWWINGQNKHGSCLVFLGLSQISFLFLVVYRFRIFSVFTEITHIFF